MVARDDSFIRGSLIACLIFLVLSLGLNFFLWRHSDTISTKEQNKSDTLITVQNNLRQMETQASRLKAMLGVGGFSEAEIEEMKQNTSDDPDLKAIEKQYATNMKYFGSSYQGEKNYPKLPEYLIGTIRKRNLAAVNYEANAKLTRSKAITDVANAKKLQEQAEINQVKAEKEKRAQGEKLAQDRKRMELEKEEAKDKMNKTSLDFAKFQQDSNQETNKLKNHTVQLKNTISTQKDLLNELRNDQFETTQGEIRYVVRGGNITTINLGSADALRPGITFGVIGGDETRLRDAKVKATIQVTKIQGAHLAEARVVAFPEIRNPIIPGDKIFSPFWAPGRVIKIALMGNIDIDGDGRPDNEALKGQIRAAGAVVVENGKLDASIRFMVVGDDPDLGSRPTDDDDDTIATIAAMGRIRTKAAELGLTVIPAWKLQQYLRTLNDTRTTPLGSATRAEDFPPDPRVSGSRLPNIGSDLYRTPNEKQQEGNKVLPP